MRTIDWVDGAVELVDQTLLPDKCVMLRIHTVDQLVDAIRRLAVRGAPALGVAGALGVVLAGGDPELIARLRAARPTAVNLAWGVDQVAEHLPEGPGAVLAAALRVRDADIAACRAMGERGADLLAGDRLRIMTVCNTGGLAAVERGTALGVVQTLHERGRLAEVLALETRPLLQGARLTTWELARMGAPHRLIADSAGPYLLAKGEVDAVLVGADRIAANGDTANKIGSYALALGAERAGVPFVVVAPESTIDQNTPSGEHIAIEDRDEDEIVAFRGVRVAPEGTRAANPAFDVTPHDLITAIVTDQRIIRP
ncbi:S-methyl-5-thioribose-1-phosphate isomerase [Nonomuraea sp. KC401]|uniref:Methylthioribose-1-phosphate isomerase n=1 Tax=Nonomuraea longispora TaxID=1848320 RepID=A0A4V2XLJ1_9ACTN|nr:MULTISPECIES: S-methyl-5-thioribose-1-phosphate isomerase [Nonomuraea]NBE99957.1 S-methyl-5-thioribose-1-phosphate isomerase [Nonomuraea sp. K271]TDC10626.1 S-methyl-5-thioribose-1-phosphate isomerase [Nonomuraea longispora]TLF54927.1 S-methyl-5-thioribose-1-phosphate isomerase [Nonomuraea sp. KC401]